LLYIRRGIYYPLLIMSTRRANSYRWRQWLATAALLHTGLVSGAGTFEQDQRINSLTLQFGTDSFATANRFGSAFTSFAQPTLNSDVSNDVASGLVSVLIEMPGLTNLAGNNQPSLNLGLVNGQPILPTNNPANYSGSADLDWWYEPNPAELTPTGAPTNQLPASIAAGVLASGVGRFSLAPNPLGGTASLDLSTFMIQATVGGSSTPLKSTNGFPPGHLPAENINPQLMSFASMNGGRLKGNVSAGSLAATPIPSSLVGNDGYTASNSLLDVLVSGYTETIIFPIVVVNPTQPDQSDPAAPVAGGGPPYVFGAATGSRTVASAHDKNGNAVNLNAALASAAYSAYFTFTTDRVIVRSPPPAMLSISDSATGIVVSWPSSLIGWNLQTNSLPRAAGWNNYPGPVVNNTVTLPPPKGNVFFRLTKP
jgi:hypothetical protein